MSLRRWNLDLKMSQMNGEELFHRLKRIHDGLQKHLTAATLAEGGDLRGAEDTMDDKTGKDEP